LAYELVALVATARADTGSREPPPTPTEWVTDNAGFLQESTRSSLDGRLGDYARTSGHQVLVWIGQTIPIRSLAYGTASRKGISPIGRSIA